MKWSDVKLATLQKMFAAEGSTITTDESTTDYLAGMPYVANEALQRLSTAGKFITKSLVIAHNPLLNMLGDSVGKAIYNIKDISFSAVDSFSYFFEFSGKGTLQIITEKETTEIQLNSKSTYTEYRGIIPNGKGLVTLHFTASYPSTVKNIALYEEQFDEEKEVPEYADKVRYYLNDIADDFYQLGDNQIFYEGGLTNEYIQLSQYYRESDNVLILNRDKPGSYTIYYRAYPAEITLDTPDDYELPLDREVAVLLPLYMASQLYKDDDNGLATSYRNEFEIGLESLIDSSTSDGFEEFVSESGWI